MPVRGSSGPGAQIPIPHLDLWFRIGSAGGIPNQSRTVTAAKPAVASVAAIGTRIWWEISPAGLTKPAATFVPPMSTPMKYCSAICFQYTGGRVEYPGHRNE